jgi:hypothetical protein
MQDQGPEEAPEGGSGGQCADHVPAGPAGLVEGVARGRQVGDAVGGACRDEAVAERDVDRHGDDEGRQVEAATHGSGERSSPRT